MRLFFLLISILVFTNPAAAETITLKSGRVLKGQLIERTSEYIKFDTGSGVLNIRYRMMDPADAERLQNPNYRPGESPQPTTGKRLTPKAAPAPTPDTDRPKDIYTLLEEKIAPRDFIFQKYSFNPKDYRQVIQELRDIPSTRPLLNIAKAYYYLEEDEAAIATALKAAEARPDDAEAFFTLGFIFWGNDEFANALKYYKKAVQLDPDLAYGQIGDIYRDMDRCQEAMNFYRDFLKAYPSKHAGLFGVYHSMGRCATMLRQFDRAIELFIKSLELNPDYAKAHLDLGYGYRLVGAYEKSVMAFHKAMELDRNNYYILKGLGDSYYDLGQIDKALWSYEKAVLLHPDIEILSRLVKTLARQGQFEKCLTYLDEAEVLEPLNPAIYQGKARYLLYLERFDEAKQNYQKAVDIYRYQGDMDKVVLLKQTLKAVEKIERRNLKHPAPR